MPNARKKADFCHTVMRQIVFQCSLPHGRLEPHSESGWRPHQPAFRGKVVSLERCGLSGKQSGSANPPSHGGFFYGLIQECRMVWSTEAQASTTGWICSRLPHPTDWSKPLNRRKVMTELKRFQPRLAHRYVSPLDFERVSIRLLARYQPSRRRAAAHGEEIGPLYSEWRDPPRLANWSDPIQLGH